MVFFCTAYNQIQKLFPIIFKQPSGGSSKDEKGELEKKYLQTFYWEVHENDVAKDGVFNTQGLTPKESVSQAACFDVLRYINLKMAYNS